METHLSGLHPHSCKGVAGWREGSRPWFLEMKEVMRHEFNGEASLSRRNSAYTRLTQRKMSLTAPVISSLACVQESLHCIHRFLSPYQWPPSSKASHFNC